MSYTFFLLFENNIASLKRIIALKNFYTMTDTHKSIEKGEMERMCTFHHMSDIHMAYHHPVNNHSSISSYLSQYDENVPQWLQNYKMEGNVSFEDVISTRVGYYPGSRLDGALMKIGNMSHSVHSFLYVDYGLSREELIDHLAQPISIRGYHSIGRIDWEEKDILPNGQNIYVNKNRFLYQNEKPYCFTEILERNENKDASWGARRFCITFLFADGIASYYQIFCKEYNKAPWIVLLQDHGFGGNYNRFGKGGILDAIVRKTEIRPEYILCADNTKIWDGYDIIDLPAVCGGANRRPRRLYQNIRR